MKSSEVMKRTLIFGLLAILLTAAFKGHGAVLTGYPFGLDDGSDLYTRGSTTVGLPTWRGSEAFISLWIQTGLIRYQTSAGKTVGLDLAFRQRNSISDPYSYSFGPNWQCSAQGRVVYLVEKNEDGGTHGAWLGIVQQFVPTMGGSLTYVPDGDTPEYNTYSSLGHGSISTEGCLWTSGYSDFSSCTYQYPRISPGCPTNATDCGDFTNYLSKTTDPQGRNVNFYYSTNGAILLQSIVDYDGRSNLFYYDAVFTNQVSAVVDAYQRTNSFKYDSLGRLTNILNAEGMSSSFLYDSAGIVTNMTTPYGTTAFRYGSDNATNNVATRWIEVTEPDGRKHLYIYRHQANKVNTNSSVDLLPSSYPTNEVPNTAPFTNSFENTWMDARNSFYWNPHSCVHLSTNYTQTGDPNNLTLADYNLASMTHWLAKANVITNFYTAANTPSMRRAASPDGVTPGQKVWLDYPRKMALVGTNSNGQNATNYCMTGAARHTSFSAYLLPDGTTHFTFDRTSKWGRVTNTISTYSTPTGVGFRTNTFVYNTNFNSDL